MANVFKFHRVGYPIKKRKLQVHEQNIRHLNIAFAAIPFLLFKQIGT